MADLTNRFAVLFAKINQAQQQFQNQSVSKSVPDMPKDDAENRREQNLLYPEKVGKKIRENKLKKEAEYKAFVKSLTDGEISNLMLLGKKGQLVISKDMLKSIGEDGTDLELDRLDDYKLIKREIIQDDGLIQFSLTSLGRRVLGDLNL